jgi:hypothetical protein
MLGERGTEVLTFRVPGTWAASVEPRKVGSGMLMVRRKNVQQTITGESACAERTRRHK